VNREDGKEGGKPSLGNAAKQEDQQDARESGGQIASARPKKKFAKRIELTGGIVSKSGGPWTASGGQGSRWEKNCSTDSNSTSTRAFTCVRGCRSVREENSWGDERTPARFGAKGMSSGGGGKKKD